MANLKNSATISDPIGSARRPRVRRDLVDATYRSDYTAFLIYLQQKGELYYYEVNQRVLNIEQAGSTSWLEPWQVGFIPQVGIANILTVLDERFHVDDANLHNEKDANSVRVMVYSMLGKGLCLRMVENIALHQDISLWWIEVVMEFCDQFLRRTKPLLKTPTDDIRYGRAIKEFEKIRHDILLPLMVTGGSQSLAQKREQETRRLCQEIQERAERTITDLQGQLDDRARKEAEIEHGFEQVQRELESSRRQVEEGQQVIQNLQS